MKIGIPKEAQDKRVAMVPATMKKIKSDQVTFLVEQGAGINARPCGSTSPKSDKRIG